MRSARNIKLFNCLLFLLTNINLCFGQYNSKLDSLQRVYVKNNFNDSVKCELLGELSLASQKVNPVAGIGYADSLNQLALKAGSIRFQALGNYAKAGNLYASSRYPEALQYYEKAKAQYGQINDMEGYNNASNGIAKVYASLSDFPKASEYRQKEGAYKTVISLHDSIAIAEKKKQEMQQRFTKKENEYILQQQIIDGKLKQKQKDLVIAEKELELKKSQLALSEKDRVIKQLAFLKEKAEKEQRGKQLSLAEKDRALKSSELEVLSKDKALQQAEIENQKKEIAVKNIQTYGFIIGIVLLLIMFFFIYNNYVNQKKSNKIISAEKEKSENLLHNILPIEVADELRIKGYADAKQFEEVTIIFTDFVNFTGISERLTPKELVTEIDVCFKAFDDISGKYGLEKIKTIGDAYMAVCGLPHNNPEHAKKVILAAGEIAAFMKTHYEKGGKFEIRIGIHSGAVVAGIVGSRKFAYDIWGDAVNTASRMESASEPGRINVSGVTYELTKNNFKFEHRGKIKVKNKGEIDMYFVEL